MQYVNRPSLYGEEYYCGAYQWKSFQYGLIRLLSPNVPLTIGAGFSAKHKFYFTNFTLGKVVTIA